MGAEGDIIKEVQQSYGLPLLGNARSVADPISAAFLEQFYFSSLGKRENRRSWYWEDLSDFPTTQELTNKKARTSRVDGCFST
jgi:hypothetical protein